jgi:DNA-binding NarL/FixJ family response regulator
VNDSPIRVAIVEDHQLYRDLLKSALDAVPDISVVVTAEGSTHARLLILPGEVDVAVLDIELLDGNGIGLGVALRRADPNLKIVLISAQDVLEILTTLPAEDRKYWSYLSKTSSTSLSVLVDTIQKASRGESVIDGELLLRSMPRLGSAVSGLTPRPFEILRLVATGLSNQGIAELLGIASNSVVNHLSAIYATLGIPEGNNARVSSVLAFLNDTSRPAS